MSECQVNSYRYPISLCWRSPGAGARSVHCVGPRQILPGYTRAKLVKAGAELVGAAMAGAKVGLRGFTGKHTNPISFYGKNPTET